MTFCSAGTDVVSVAIRERVGCAIPVSTFAEIEELLLGLARPGPRRGVPVTVDLSFHSKDPDHVIVLGDGEVRSGDPALERFVVRCGAALRALDVRALRLLGCETAASEVGRATIADLGRRLGLDVCGTLDAVGADDFTDYGFKDVYTYRLYPGPSVAQPALRAG